jgi:hypothetical protein
MKYYFIVNNSSGDNLGVFETVEEAVAWMEKKNGAFG